MTDQAQTQPTIIRYEVTNIRTGIVTTYKTRTGAMKAQDRMDHAYGAVCTICRAIWSDHV